MTDGEHPAAPGEQGPVAAWTAFASVGRLHIVAIASVGTLTFAWALFGVRPWALAAVCALDWYVVNLLNRVVDVPEDRVNAIPAVDFVERHRRGLTALGFGLLVASLVATHLAVPALTPWRLLYHALGLAYNWPLLPGRRRLKQLYFWKNTASATGFLLTVFAYPLAWLGSGPGALPLCPDVDGVTIGVAAGFFFLFELSYEILYDLRDAPGDRALGVRSYPAVHGEGAAVRGIDALLAASLAVLAIGALAGPVPWRLAVMGAAPLVQFAAYKAMLRRGGITSARCIGLTWLGVALLVAYHVWVVLDLPGAAG
jgi:4-hydroxybenzoate polyprenyltransferase